MGLGRKVTFRKRKEVAEEWRIKKVSFCLSPGRQAWEGVIIEISTQM